VPPPDLQGPASNAMEVDEDEVSLCAFVYMFTCLCACVFEAAVVE